MKRPNILILYTDQQRWDALGAAGNPQIKTPHLDALAASGVNFSRHFVQNPVCMPSRISFLTGQYPSTLGITHMGVPVPEDTPTLPRLLKPYGYRSANIGKLHFLPHANRDHRVPHPDYGFDHLEISDEPGVYEDAYRAWVRRLAPDQLDHLSVGLPPATDVWNRAMGVKDTVHHPSDGPRFDFKGAVPFPGQATYTHSAFVAEQTLEFIDNQSDAQPFMCIAGFYSPHSPWVVPQQFLDLYDPDQLELPVFPPDLEAQRGPDHFPESQLRSAQHGYYAMVSEVDHHVGRILARLQERGLSEDTIVLFTSDHGEWLGEHLRYGKGHPGADAVSRVPLIARWPSGGWVGGRTVDDIVAAVDVVPTLMEGAGMQIAPHLQGQSLAPALTGQSWQGRGSALMESNGWKNLRTDRYRYLVHEDGHESLWDVQEDPSEYRDVADDPGHAQVLADMRHRLLQQLVGQERPLDRAWTY
ncbi:MAG: sulfatase-like hydrolase/transferase [Candidatus Latescibacteria bacterium]|nr:sulfatase-like hydrolase/transferase [Candidatus Latescibacterota bacterium]